MEAMPSRMLPISHSNTKGYREACIETLPSQQSKREVQISAIQALFVIHATSMAMRSGALTPIVQVLFIDVGEIALKIPAREPFRHGKVLIEVVAALATSPNTTR